jgi:hypothetical protein
MHSKAYLIAALGGVALVGCETLASRDAVDRGREACRDEIRDEDYRIVDFGTTQRGERRVVYGVRLERDGDAYRGLCIYDTDDRRARLDVARAGDTNWLDSRARELCVEEARDRDYDVREIRDTDVDDGKIRVRMDLERDGRDYRGRCIVDRDDYEVDFEADRS